MTIRFGQLAHRAGVSTRSWRYYEQEGLPESARTTGGQRYFDDGAVERVQLIQQLYAAGLPSRTIVDLLPCATAGLVTGGMYDKLQEQRALIEQRIADLMKAEAKLDGVLEHVRHVGIYDGNADTERRSTVDLAAEPGPSRHG